MLLRDVIFWTIPAHPAPPPSRHLTPLPSSGRQSADRLAPTQVRSRDASQVISGRLWRQLRSGSVNQAGNTPTAAGIGGEMAYRMVTGQEVHPVKMGIS